MAVDGGQIKTDTGNRMGLINSGTGTHGSGWRPDKKTETGNRMGLIHNGNGTHSSAWRPDKKTDT